MTIIDPFLISIYWKFTLMSLCKYQNPNENLWMHMDLLLFQSFDILRLILVKISLSDISGCDHNLALVSKIQYIKF